jgi:hypothetical protein
VTGFIFENDGHPQRYAKLLPCQSLVVVTRQPSTQTRHGAKLVRLERTLSEEKYGAAMRLNAVPGPSSNARTASASRQLSRRAIQSTGVQI